MTQQTNETNQRRLPCVVQLGFVGSRFLFGDKPENADWNQKTREHLKSSLEVFANKLDLGKDIFFCGISALAIGSDSFFAELLNELGEPHRIFLPQRFDDFINAKGSQGDDFTADQKKHAQHLIQSDNVIQELVVSRSTDRHDQFREANAEILRVSDIVICLLREDSDLKAGGTSEFVKRATKIGKPILEIRVRVENEQPVFTNHWHLDCKPAFHKPDLPTTTDGLRLPEGVPRIPESTQYIDALKEDSSDEARKKRKNFVNAAYWLILTGVIASLMATLSLLASSVVKTEASKKANSNPPVVQAQPDTTRMDKGPSLTNDPTGPVNNEVEKKSPWRYLVPALVILELLTLLFGWSWHIYAHTSAAVRQWANARVVSELARSTRSLEDYYLHLEHLFRLQLPWNFRHLLRTINVLHLRSNRGNAQSWKVVQKRYLANRIQEQRNFYASRLGEERKLLERYDNIFKVFLWLAILFAAARLFLVIQDVALGTEADIWTNALSGLALIFPVLAVAGLSWAGVLDYQARVETFSEAVNFLDRQEKLIDTASSKLEFDRLVTETETVLLGENANWYSRRANSGV